MITYNQFLEEAFKRTGKRIGFVTFSHGSDEDSIKSIKKSGPKPSSKGSEGPGHYVTSDRKKASQYAEFTAKARGKKPGVVSYRVSSKAIQRTSDIPKGLTSQVKTTKAKPVVKNTRTGHSVMDPDYANRTMIQNPQPIIQRKKKNSKN
jgi:hypothetical protein